MFRQASDPYLACLGVSFLVCNLAFILGCVRLLIVRLADSPRKWGLIAIFDFDGVETLPMV
jgi:hypothetical protein